jgi:hypothetical protein
MRWEFRRSSRRPRASNLLAWLARRRAAGLARRGSTAGEAPHTFGAAEPAPRQPLPSGSPDCAPSAATPSAQGRHRSLACAAPAGQAVSRVSVRILRVPPPDPRVYAALSLNERCLLPSPPPTVSRRSRGAKPNDDPKRGARRTPVLSGPRLAVVCFAAQLRLGRSRLREPPSSKLPRPSRRRRFRGRG